MNCADSMHNNPRSPAQSVLATQLEIHSGSLVESSAVDSGPCLSVCAQQLSQGQVARERAFGAIIVLAQLSRYQ